MQVLLEIQPCKTFCQHDILEASWSATRQMVRR